MRAAFISHSDCGRHDTGWGHPEHVGRLRAITRALRGDHHLFAALAAQCHMSRGFLFRKGGVDTGLTAEELLRCSQHFLRTVTGGGFLERSIAL